MRYNKLVSSKFLQVITMLNMRNRRTSACLFGIFFGFTVLFVLLCLRHAFEASHVCLTDFNVSQHRPVIQTMTTFFGQSLLPVLGNRASCPYKCTYVDGAHSAYPHVSIGVYHLPDWDGTMPRCHSPDMVDVALVMESPANISPSKDSPLFERVMSYSEPLSRAYDQLAPLTPNTLPKDRWTADEIEAAVSRKTKAVTILVSNCETHSAREYYIQALKWYIPVTVFGDCNGNRISNEDMAQVMDNHFFYLAFENSVCERYVTEKAWRFKDLIVPIVLNRRVAESQIPPDAFIAADDFPDAKSLATYLINTMSNHTRYLQYFNWTKRYSKKFSPPLSGCQLCEFAWTLRRNASAKTEVLNSGRNALSDWRASGNCQTDFALRLLSREEQYALSTFMPFAAPEERSRMAILICLAILIGCIICTCGYFVR